MSLLNKIKNKKNKGVSLTEVILSVALLSLIFATFSKMTASSLEQIKVKNTADKMQIVFNASREYLNKNATNLLKNMTLNTNYFIPIGKKTITGSIPNGPTIGSVTFNSVQGDGFLPDSYIDSNAYNQNHILIIRKTDGPTTSSSDDIIESIVSTYSSTVQIPDRLLGTAATLLGASGGYVPEKYVNSADNGYILGTYNSWRSQLSTWSGNTASPKTGNLVETMAFNANGVISDYLYRNDIGIPEANRMNTNIDMNNNNLRKVNTITPTDETSGTVKIDPNLQVAQNLTVGGNADITGNLNVTGDTTLTNNLTVNGSSIKLGDTTSDYTTVQNLKANKIDVGSMDVYDSRTSSYSRGINETNTSIKLGDLLPRMVPQYSYAVDSQIASTLSIPKPNCQYTAGSSQYSRAKIMLFSMTSSERGVVEDFRTTSGATIDSSHPGFTNVAHAILAVSNGSNWDIRFIGKYGNNNINDEALISGSRVSRKAIAMTFCYYQ